MIELLKSKDSRYKCYIIHRVCFDFPQKKKREGCNNFEENKASDDAYYISFRAITLLNDVI